MNYKNESLRELQSFGAEQATYSVGEIIFSVINKKTVENGGKISWLLDISNEDMFSVIEKVREIEQKETE